MIVDHTATVTVRVTGYWLTCSCGIRFDADTAEETFAMHTDHASHPAGPDVYGHKMLALQPRFAYEPLK